MAITKHAETSGFLTAQSDVTIPGTPQENDIVLVAAVSDSGTSVGTSLIATAGYTSIDDHSTSLSPGNQIAIKRMGASPDTVVNIRTTAARTAYIIRVYRGVDPTTAIDNGNGTAPTGSSGLPDPATYTTVTANALRIAAGFLDDDDAASGITAPTNFSDVLAQDTGQASTSVGSTVMIATQDEASPGAEDPPAFTGGTGTDAWRAVHFALRPAAGAGGDGTLTSQGTSTAAIGSSAAKSAAMISAGSSTVTLAGASDTKATLLSSGVSTVTFDGASEIAGTLGTLLASGVGSATFEGASRSDQALSAAGATAAIFEGASRSDQVLAAAGLSPATLVGASLSAQTLLANGVSSVALDSSTVAIISATLVSAGNATVALSSSAAVSAALTAAGESIVAFDSSVAVIVSAALIAAGTAEVLLDNANCPALIPYVDDQGITIVYADDVGAAEVFTDVEASTVAYADNTAAATAFADAPVSTVTFTDRPC